MKKKLVSLFLVGVMTVGMTAGCGSSGNGDNAAAENNGDVANTVADDADNTLDATETAEDTFNGTYSNKQVIIGDISETSGDITPFWANGSSDYTAYKMVVGMAPIERDQTGKWVENPTVASILIVY